MATDFNFTFDGFAYMLMPNNQQAQEVWNQIAAHFPDARIPLHAWASVKLQLQQAGYSVRKAVKRSAVDDDDVLLAALMA